MLNPLYHRNLLNPNEITVIINMKIIHNRGEFMLKNPLYFLTIVEEGNLSLAAQKLFLTQPALSKYIARLEEELGVELFYHHSSPLKLTPAGAHYLEYIRKAVHLEQQFKHTLAEMDNGPAGELSIGLTSWLGTYILPSILPKFMKEYPDVEIRILEGKSSSLLNALEKNQIDFYITYPFNLEKHSQYTCDIIFYEHILLIGNKSYVESLHLMEKSEAGGGPYPYLNLSLLKNENFILSPPGHNIFFLTENLFQKYHVFPSKVMHIGNIMTLVSLVNALNYFSFIPESAYKGGLLSDNIQKFTVDAPALQWPLAVFYKKDALLSPAAKAFIGELKSRDIL